MTTCKCGHNEDDHREGVFECGASIIHQEAEFFCGCEDFEPAEPSTEGTQAAQVDAPSLREKIEANLNATGDWLGRTPEELERLRAEPAVAQTELPPLEAYCYGSKNHNFYLKRDVDERIASLTQRLQEKEAQTELPSVPQTGLSDPEAVTADIVWVSQEYAKQVITTNQDLRERIAKSEAREAELKAQLKDVLDRESASAKRHDDRMEALERSHKALLEDKCKLIGSIIDRIDMAPNDDPVPYIREYVAHFISVTETGK